MLSAVKKNAENALEICGIDDKSYRDGIIKTANALREMNDIVIICHKSPDGDTLGSASALCRGLRSLGKRANVKCADEIPQKYSFMFDNLNEHNIVPQHFVSVDIAAPHLMGALEAEYGDKLDVCIDHHRMNSVNAGVKFVDDTASATGEVIWILLKAMGVKLDKSMSECLFAAISTDTGCFKYSNVTIRTHLIAIQLMQLGIDCAGINFKLIDEETPSKLALKNMALSTLDYYCGGKCAVITITSQMMTESKAMPEDMDGVASIPRSISGVECGITMKQDGEAWKISVRSTDKINAADLCARFGGGGHKAAAGCKLATDYDDAKAQLVEAVTEMLGNHTDKN
ncbi:MAG: DHH family phosphoesterase [Firmicutes bacterium]|nr:DHH family phosphoesterase [Bacillota bacterium]